MLHRGGCRPGMSTALWEERQTDLTCAVKLACTVAGESKEQIDAYTAHMLASLGGTQQGSVVAAESAAAADGGWGLQGPGLELKPEDWQPELGEGRAGECHVLQFGIQWNTGPGLQVKPEDWQPMLDKKTASGLRAISPDWITNQA
eukprot:1159831-Pelagomonas_calceolata.AAC.2